MSKPLTLDTELFLPRPREEVFPFFADAFNLEAITPPFLRFKVTTEAPIEMQVGALIDYKLRLHGIPITWRTRIAAWEPPYRFVDEQLKGPYSLWRHEHTFEEVEGYDDMVMLRSIRMESHCEHHMVPILGVAHIAYMPDRRVVGISKLARVLDSFSKRLQTQETLTAQVADCIQQALQPRGVAILIDAQHQCMTTRGVRKPDVSMVTTRFTGLFQTDSDLQARFLNQARMG